MSARWRVVVMESSVERLVRYADCRGSRLGGRSLFMSGLYADIFPKEHIREHKDMRAQKILIYQFIEHFTLNRQHKQNYVQCLISFFAFRIQCVLNTKDVSCPSAY